PGKHNTNAALIAGSGTSGYLVSCAARHNALAIIIGATLVGGIEASGSLLQRRLGLPDATPLILQGLPFTNLLVWEAMMGRVNQWRIALAERSAKTDDAEVQYG